MTIVVNDSVERLGRAARVALAVGAAGSLGLMLYAGRHQRSIPLILLFTGWVSSPFIALAILDRWTVRWRPLLRAALYGVMCSAAIGSLLVYTFDALNPRPQAAFFYVAMPPATWIIGGAVLAVAALLARPTA